jgi:hypothetical protein
LLPSETTSILLHTASLPVAFEATVEDGVLYGRGASDMKTAIIILGVVIVALAIYSFSTRHRVSPEKKASMIAETPKSFYELTYTDIDGKPVSMSAYKGKYVLCVNVASKCGHTPQYAKLEALYEKFKDKLVIIGFPCNQFLGQEPGSEKEIAEFCTKNYGVTFPLSSKIDVKGHEKLC